jgi:hypothetical protein
MIDFSNTTPALLTGIVHAQAKIQHTIKDLTGQEGNRTFDYADLPATIDAIKPALQEAGLGVVQSTTYNEGIVTVDTVVFHKEGGSIRSSSNIPCEKAGAKAVGSATTYMRRYELLALFFIASKKDDDDGDASEGKGSKTTTAKPDKISPEQVAVINDLVNQCGVNINKDAFLKNFMVKSIPQLSVVQFPQAKTMLEKKLKGLAEKESQNAQQ